MKMGDYRMKYGWWLSLLVACTLSGCANGPQQPKGAWPWEHAKDTGNYQTGNYFTISGNVANFGEAPQAVNPAAPESLGPRIPPQPAPEKPAAKAPPSLLPPDMAGPGKVAKAEREYDFVVRDVKIAPPSYLPANSVSTTFDITAFNRGHAPVSVAIGIDAAASGNVSTDKTLPLNAVISPHTDTTVVHVGPKIKNESYHLNYAYSWSIGDYTARHDCPEHYRFPFGDDVRAYASVNDKANATPYTRYAVIFSMPARIPVLAARKGTVVRVKTEDRIDILHDDSTIATYRHLGTIADGVSVGKAVSTEDVIGTVGAGENPLEGYIQLTVWRPEPPPDGAPKTNSPGPGFELVSFPLEFCSAGSDDCGVLTQSQPVSRKKVSEIKKKGKRKSKAATRKDRTL